MALVLLISDTQLSNHKNMSKYDKNGINTRLIYQIEAIKEAINFGIKNKCTEMIHFGDVFHIRGVVEPEPITLFKELMHNSNWLEMSFFITGNHDILEEGNKYTNCLYMLNWESSKIIDRYYRYNIDGRTFHMFPHSYSIQDMMNTIEDIDVKDSVLCIHQSIIGTKSNKYVLKDGIDRSFLKKFKLVLCGDVHTPQRIDNIQILGSPYKIDFGDVGDRYCYILNTKNLSIKPFKVKHPDFINANKIKKGDLYNFYKIPETDKTKVYTDNVLVVPKIEQTFVSRNKDISLEKLVHTYCKSANRPDMVQHGLNILKTLKKA